MFADSAERIFDPAYVIISLDALFQYANMLRQGGALDQSFRD
jgi:hypothetical protein